MDLNNNHANAEIDLSDSDLSGELSDSSDVSDSDSDSSDLSSDSDLNSEVNTSNQISFEFFTYKIGVKDNTINSDNENPEYTITINTHTPYNADTDCTCVWYEKEHYRNMECAHCHNRHRGDIVYQITASIHGITTHEGLLTDADKKINSDTLYKWFKYAFNNGKVGHQLRSKKMLIMFEYGEMYDKPLIHTTELRYIKNSELCIVRKQYRELAEKHAALETKYAELEVKYSDLEKKPVNI